MTMIIKTNEMNDCGCRNKTRRSGLQFILWFLNCSRSDLEINIMLYKQALFGYKSFGKIIYFSFLHKISVFSVATITQNI